MRTVPKATALPFTAIVEADGVSLSGGAERILGRVSSGAWTVMQCVDGTRTVGEIAAALSSPEPAVWRHLDELADTGLIEPLSPPAAKGPLDRRGLLGGALLAGGALGLAAAAPAFASAVANEEASKHAREERVKSTQSRAEESQVKRHQRQLAAEQSRKSAAESHEKAVRDRARAMEERKKSTMHRSQEQEHK